MQPASPPYRLRLAFALATLAASVPIQAQTMADPTRPPAAWLAAQARPAGAPEALVPEVVTAPDVQIVVSGPTRQFAMVDGVAVRPGETYKGARLVSVHSGPVWLKGGSVLQPNVTSLVEKKTMGDARSATPAKPRKKKINGGSR